MNSGPFKKVSAQNFTFSKRCLLTTLYKIATAYSYQLLSFSPPFIVLHGTFLA